MPGSLKSSRTKSGRFCWSLSSAPSAERTSSDSWPSSKRKSCKTVPTDRSSSTIRTRILGSAQQEEYQRLPGISGGTSGAFPGDVRDKRWRSEEHTSELQSHSDI